MEAEKYGSKLPVSEVLSLVDICLESIRKNFDRFNTAYCITEDPFMKKNLLFLQRLYSSYFINDITTNGANSGFLDKKYFDFLINEYLKELDTGIFHLDDWNIATKLICKIGHTFETVKFTTRPLELCRDGLRTFPHGFMNKVLPYIPNVKTLYMQSTSKCEDATLKLISSCKELRQLVIINCPISNEGLKHLCVGKDKLNLKSLTLFNICGCDEGIGFLLQNMPSLEVIDYCTLPMVLHGLHEGQLRSNTLAGAQKYNLISLQLNAQDFAENTARFQEALEIMAEVCPLLSEVTVFDICLNTHLRTIANFSNLSSVKLTGLDSRGGVKLTANEFLASCGKNLTVLRLQFFRLSVTELIRYCGKLECIWLGNIDYLKPCEGGTSRRLQNLTKAVFQSLKGRDSLSNASFSLFLDSCPRIEELFFKTCSFEVDQDLNTIVKRFCERTRILQKLAFTECSFVRSLLAFFSLSSMSLKKLILDCCDDFTHSDVTHLEKFLKVNKIRIVIESHFESALHYESDEDYSMLDEWLEADDDEYDNY